MRGGQGGARNQLQAQRPAYIPTLACCISAMGPCLVLHKFCPAQTGACCPQLLVPGLQMIPPVLHTLFLAECSQSMLLVHRSIPADDCLPKARVCDPLTEFRATTRDPLRQQTQQQLFLHSRGGASRQPRIRGRRSRRHGPHAVGGAPGRKLVPCWLRRSV